MGSYRANALKFRGRAVDGYEWGKATMDVKNAWQSQGMEEASFVTAQEYGGLILGGAGAAATLAGIGTALVVTAALPEEITGSMVGTVIISGAGIVSRTFSDATVEAGWKTSMDQFEEWWKRSSNNLKM